MITAEGAAVVTDDLEGLPGCSSDCGRVGVTADVPLIRLNALVEIEDRRDTASVTDFLSVLRGAGIVVAASGVCLLRLALGCLVCSGSTADFPDDVGGPALPIGETTDNLRWAGVLSVRTLDCFRLELVGVDCF